MSQNPLPPWYNPNAEFDPAKQAEFFKNLGPYGSPPINQQSSPRYSTAGGNGSGWSPRPGMSQYKLNLMKYLGGLDPQSFLRAQGMGFSNQGPATTFSQDGKSYTSVGAQHEGGGQGGQSRFLQDLGYSTGSPQGQSEYGGDVAMMDKAMASVGQGNINQVAQKAAYDPAFKAQLAASGKDIFGNSAWGVAGGAHGTPGGATPGGGKPPVVSTNTPPQPTNRGPVPHYAPPPRKDEPAKADPRNPVERPTSYRHF